MAINVADMAFVLPVARRHWGVGVSLMMVVAAGLCAFGVVLLVEGVIVRVEGMSPAAYRRYGREHRSAVERKRMGWGMVVCGLAIAVSMLAICRR
jgi:hypothetical protein